MTPAKSSDAASTPSVPRYSFYALGILSLVNFLNYIDRQVLPAVAPVMLKDAELNLTDAELGYMEAALLLSFTVLAPLFGRLGDRYPRAKLMASAAVIWSIATAVTGFVDRLPFLPSSLNLQLPLVNATIMLSGAALALCLVRAAVGVGESAYSTITPSLIADYFPPQRRATALGVFQAAIPMGFALGFVIGGVLAHFFGWRVAFMIVGVPGLITAAMVWRLKEPVRGATDEPHADADADAQTALEEIAESPSETSRALVERQQGESSWKSAWRILRTRDWLISTIGYTALTFALGAFATWATVLLVRDKGMSETSAAITLGVVVLLAGAAGTFGGGWLADRVAAKRQNAYFLVCAVSTLLGILPTIVGLVAVDARIFLPAIFISVTMLFISNAPFHAILLESVPTHVRAMAVALNIVVIHTFGDAISRAAVGLLSDSLKTGGFRTLAALANAVGIDASRQHLSTALLITPFALLVSTIFFFWGARGAKR
ncbi:MAG TPA: MFS transporter [Pyrinomonadaceae bacterium]